MRNHSRRKFMKQLALALAAAPFVGAFTRSFLALAKDAAPAALPPGQKAAPESDPVASAIGYRANIKDIDYAKYPQRKKPAAKNQFCDNCALYTPANAGWGKCQMIASGLVAAKGWCGSWSKKS